MSALHAAIVQGKDNVAAAIVSACVLGEHGCADTHPRTLLMAAFHALPETIALLVEAGADPTVLSPSGKTVLHAAVQSGSAATVAALLDGPAIKVLDHAARSGDTALHTAARNGHYEVARILLDAGANRHLCTESYFFGLLGGQTAAQIASEAGHPDVVQLIETHVVPERARSDL
jgi:ankyrin repeat protein